MYYFARVLRSFDFKTTRNVTVLLVIESLNIGMCIRDGCLNLNSKDIT